jgi:hypothetical protein
MHHIGPLGWLIISGWTVFILVIVVLLVVSHFNSK